MRHVRNNLVGLVCMLAFLAGMLLLGCPGTVLAAEAAQPELKEAQAAMVVDSAGNVLYEKNPDAEINMASITKIMTAVVALESGTPMDKVCTLSKPDLQPDAVLAGYKDGDTSTFRELMQVMLVHSANDAAYEVALAVSGSEQAFVQKMNEKAKELGLTHTHFQNPHGLDAEGHHSSVRDLTTLARYAMTTQPFIASTVRMSEVTVQVGDKRLTFETSDRLLGSYKGMLGIKTGAGNNVTSFLGCARRDNATLYTCVLGCETYQGRFDDTASLLDWAFSSYRRYTLANAKVALRTEPFAYDFSFACPVYADETTTGLVWPEGGQTTYRKIMLSDGMLLTPGEPFAACQWTQDGRVVATASYSARPHLIRSRAMSLFEAPALLGPDAGTKALGARKAS